jgi:hypothetical protein
MVNLQVWTRYSINFFESKFVLSNLYDFFVIKVIQNSITLASLQQKVSMYTKWFHWILSEFIGCSEWGVVKKQWIHWSSEQKLVNCTHIL